MSKASINFELLASELNNYITSFVPRWISGGEQKGNEYHAASIYGGKGDSFRINLSTGKWSDFANDDHKGHNLIQLYAAINNVKPSFAAATLAEMIGFQSTHPDNLSDKLPNMISSKHGKPTKHWIYRSKRGFPCALVVRYDPPQERKQFTQWHFSQTEQKWIPKAHPDLRPLYQLDKLDRNPSLPVVVCEGEKAADACQSLYGDTAIATCWLGGSQALSKTDFSPLYGRSVTLWPDNDEAGIMAMTKLSKLIVLRVSSLFCINPDKQDPEKFDADDLLLKAPSIHEFSTYLSTRTKVIKAISSASSPAVVSPTNNEDSQTGEMAPIHGIAEPYSEDDQELAILNDSRVMVKWEKLGLMMKSETKVYQNETNVIKILQQTPKFKASVYYDDFFKSYMSTFGSTKPESFSDITFTRFKLAVQSEYGMGDISTATIKEALRYYASGVIRNEVSDYLKTLKWDGQPRIESFMNLIYGADNSPYNSAVSRIFWLSLAARILDPGCKADIMVILEGGQGIQKSSSLEEIGSLLGRDFYSVAGKKLDNKDFYIGLQGKFIVEMGEINAILKNSDEDIKEMLSTRIDNYRIPYATESTPNSRTNIFVGTTNQENYLRDETGSRRFLPVKCSEVNMDLLRDNKLQFFAEAVHRKLSGEDHWEFPKDLAKIETEKRMEIEDPWFDYVEEFCSGLKNVRTIDVMYHLQLEPKRQERKEANRIAKILKKLKYEVVKKRVNGEPTWIFENNNINSNNTSWEKVDKIKKEANYGLFRQS